MNYGNIFIYYFDILSLWQNISSIFAKYEAQELDSVMLPRVKACPLVGAGLYSDLSTSPWKPGVVLKSAPWLLGTLKKGEGTT